MKLRSNRQTATDAATDQLRQRKNPSQSDPTPDMMDTSTAAMETNQRRDAKVNHQVNEEKHASDAPLTHSSSDAALVNDLSNDGAEQDHFPPTFSWEVVRRVLHINIFLYAACFWLQTGVLPVRM